MEEAVCSQCRSTEVRKTRTKIEGHWFEELVCIKCGNALEGRLVQKARDALPKESEPVLAELAHQGDLGKATWYEVVYYDEESGRWRSYHGSKTFEDGEQVVRWVYAKRCFPA